MATSTEMRDLLKKPEAYRQRAELGECDLVMKGGATSGVIYPLAACEIARDFRFRNIGGTSAGAIAAAGTAAAEFGRAGNADRGGFPELAQIPETLGKDGFLLKLFRPQPSMEPLFKILLATTGSRQDWKWPTLKAAVRGFPLWAVLFALPGAAAVALGAVAIYRQRIVETDGITLAVALGLVVAGILLLAVGSLIGIALGLYRKVTRTLPANHYGITTGMGDREAGEPTALTDWLYEELSRLAGVDSKYPLTFGDLWLADSKLRETNLKEWEEKGANLGEWEAMIGRCSEDVESRVINLEMMTTCINHGRPYRFPLRTKQFYFKKSEFAEFFPEPVVDWMVRRSRDGKDLVEKQIPTPDGVEEYYRLPEPHDLPVIVATRMSLSVPLLFSAIPLYAVDYTLKEDRRLERCWFMDGGITSNFPVHFFDAPLPGRPTFGINLRPLCPDGSSEDNEPLVAASVDPCDSSPEAVYVGMAKSNSDGSGEYWIRFEEREQPAGRGGTPVAYKPNIAGLLEAIMQTALNWTDNLQIPRPGYRDRVAHVYLDKGEGGMNLQMETPAIERIAERGRCAGVKIRRRFSPFGTGDGTRLTWDNHRWLRYRRTMASLETFLRELQETYDKQVEGERSYAELIAHGPGEEPRSYRFSNNSQRTFAMQVTDQLVAAVRSYLQKDQSFRDDSAPGPENPLRLVPPQ